jgi:hypothetical protein
MKKKFKLVSETDNASFVKEEQIFSDSSSVQLPNLGLRLTYIPFCGTTRDLAKLS